MNKKIIFSICFLLLFLIKTNAQEKPLLGFFPQSREPEWKYEAVFLNTPTPTNERKWLRWLTEEPHVAGTEADRKTAEYVRDRLSEFGIQAELVPYEVYLNYPKKASLKMTAPRQQELSLREEGDTLDKDSYSSAVFPAFHGYGASGKASAQVVYVNYGTREDFEKLDELGISVEGRIVLVRYGQVFRGLKVREAQEHGATGILIYSDPADDGYMKGDIYPNGPMRPESAIQRGSVQFLSEGPGDPTTRGWASTKGARRTDPIQVRMAKIPSLPISYGEARKILESLAGQRVPDEWQGGLPFAYHIGPGEAEVEMEVEMDYAYRTIWNVMGRIPGNTEADRWVVLGNHRDAWTYGAVDPNSGTASFLETARGLSEAWKAGWRPHRTIVLASWDGEEYGLLGSTEWAEDKATELQQKAVAYVNLDSSVTGANLDVDGIPSLRDLVLEVASAIPEPRAGGTVLEAWKNKKKKDWAKTEPVDLHEPDKEFYLNLQPLGSGSDYTAFVDHLGIASLSFSFEGPYGVYHSIFDDLYWMEHFGDPEFLYHVTASRFYGLLAMRLAGADLVPMRYAPYAQHLSNDLDDIRRNNIVEIRQYSEKETKKKPPLNPDFSPIQKVLQDFTAAAKELDTALDTFESTGSKDPATLLNRNDAIVQLERDFLDPAGLPARPWFKHVLFAPGFTTGYASWPLPGITQALKDRDAALFETESTKLITHLQTAIARMREITSLIRK